MILSAIALEPCVLRKTDPKWRFALGASPVTEGVVVTLTAENGMQGFRLWLWRPRIWAPRAKA